MGGPDPLSLLWIHAYHIYSLCMRAGKAPTRFRWSFAVVLTSKWLFNFAYWELDFHVVVFSSSDFFKSTFRKIISGIPSECQTVWIQIRTVGPDMGKNCLQRLSADDTSNNMMTLTLCHINNVNCFSLECFLHYINLKEENYLV